MASSSIFKRFADQINVATDADKPSRLSRYIGGHGRKNHPHVSGYWQFFLLPPEAIFSDNISGKYEDWWNATAEGFTPPTRNLNKADVPGQGGLGSSWITGQTLNRTFSVTFREYRDLVIYNLFCLWTSVIDPYTGVSPLSGDKWLGESYKGEAFAILTRPTNANETLTSNDIEEVYYFTGVWPENQPDDALASDISGPNLTQITMNFSFDGWPLTKKDDNVLQAAEEKIKDKSYLESTYNRFVENLST